MSTQVDKDIRILLCNTLCSDRTFGVLFHTHNVKSSNSAQNFFKLLIKGLASSNNVDVSVLSLLPVNSSEQKKIFWNFPSETEQGIHYQYIPLINLPLIRNLSSNLYVFFKILFKKFFKDKYNYVLVDYLRFSINASALIACKLRGIKVITVVTDMPGLGVTKKFMISKIRDKLIFHLAYDYYVCLTQPLNDIVNKKRKPSLIIEGFIDQDIKCIENKLSEKFTKRVVIYAGSLYERYGIKTLMEGFMLIPDPDVQLWLFGTGPFVGHLGEFTRTDPRIQYKGVIPTAELLQILFKATLLVNPRPTHEEYTLYSFPSKNLEYMSTGTPLLTTRLPGIPADHYPYIYLIEEESVEGIYKSLSEVLNKPGAALHAFGLAAKEFTLREKNNARQAEKIIEMLQSNP